MVTRPTWDHPDADPIADINDAIDRLRELSDPNSQKLKVVTIIAPNERRAAQYRELLGVNPRASDGREIRVVVPEYEDESDA